MEFANKTSALSIDTRLITNVRDRLLLVVVVLVLRSGIKLSRQHSKDSNSRNKVPEPFHNNRDPMLVS